LTFCMAKSAVLIMKLYTMETKFMIMFYFSATGNSKYVADLFCKKTNAACYSIEENVDFVELLGANEIIGFCYPIYGSRVPKLMREFVENNAEILCNKKIIIFCTQYIWSGDGARAFTDLLPRDSVEVIYAEHFFMPNNICNFFLLPLESKKKIAKYPLKTERKMQRVCDNIEKGIVKKRGFNPISKALGAIQGSFFPRFEKMAKNRVWLDKDCNKCRLCIIICPMDNFDDEHDKITTNNNCMMCYRCINKCPQKAIRVFLRKKVKKQFKGVGRYDG